MKKITYPVSPLRYPGAKRWLSSYLVSSIRQNELRPKHFLELFTGGATVSLALLSEELVESVILNDLDPLVAAFWQTAIFDSDWLVERIEDAEVSLNAWEYQKHSRFISVRDRAFKCLFLNRTSFSGLLTKRAGPIGGKSQTSEYKIDCRFNKATIINRIRKASQFKDRIQGVWCEDWKTALRKFACANKLVDPAETFIYLDPPFFHKANNLYNFYFSMEDHKALKEEISGLDRPWILSYDLCEESMDLYRDLSAGACGINIVYTASQRGERKNGKELIVSNLGRMVSEINFNSEKTTNRAVGIPATISTLEHPSFDTFRASEINAKQVKP